MLSLPIKVTTKSVSLVHSLTWVLMVQRQHSVNTAAALFRRSDLRRGPAGGSFVCDDLLEALDAVVSEGRDAILTDPVDAQTAIFGEHVDLEFPQPFLILAELFGDVVDGEDVRDGRQGQAA